MAKKARYSSRKKQSVLNDLAAFNAEHGRGGVAYVMKKHKLSFPTVKRWLAASDGDNSAKRKKGKMPRKGNAAVSASVKNRIMKKLNAVMEMEKKIAGLQGRIEKEKAELRALLG